jgi:hypothetical protein
MRFSKLGKIQSKKRGISSIVGGVFFLVLMVTGFTVYFLALDSQARMIDTQQIIADVGIKKIHEKFSIATSIDTLDSNRLEIQVGNEGKNAIEIADVWIVDKTDADQPVTQYELDYSDAHIPVGFAGDILENTPLFMGTAVYDVKVVSTLGTIVIAELDILGLGDHLQAQLFAIPPDVDYAQVVRMALFVTNVGDVEITGVVPTLPLVVDPIASVFSFTEIDTAPVDLEPLESAFFTWDYTLIGTFNSVVTFSTDATGSMSGIPVTSNLATDTTTIRDPTGGGGMGDELIVEETFLARPKIFMIIPSPFGDDGNDQALWGVNVVNPTPNEMEVRKVTISALTSRPQKPDKIFDESPSGCVINTIAPTPPNWVCSAQNQLTWTDFNTPIVIAPFENFPFLIRVQPGSLATSAADLETVMVQANVFTTFGQFGKTGYGSAMANQDSSLVSVYLSGVPDSTAWGNILGEIDNLPAGDPVTLHATIADFDGEGNFKIEAGSRLIINIPLDWELQTPVTPDPDFSTITVQSSIGQTQIIAELAADLPAGAKSLTFTVTPPCVSFTKFFVMHILADGHVLDDTTPHFTIGPLAETVLEVNPNVLCT